MVKSVCFSAAVKQSGGKREPCLQLVRHPLCSAHLYRSSCSATVKDAASDEVCENAEAPVSFESDESKNFGFPMSGNDKREKVNDRQIELVILRQ